MQRVLCIIILLHFWWPAVPDPTDVKLLLSDVRAVRITFSYPQTIGTRFEVLFVIQNGYGHSLRP